jgi:excisionase family DNA binding protein
MLPPEPQLCTVTEVARLLGVRRSTVLRWVRQGFFPPPLISGGNRWRRWRRLDVERYLTSLRSEPTPPPAA